MGGDRLMSRDELGIKELFTYSMVIGEEVEMKVDAVKTLGWRRDNLGGVWFASSVQVLTLVLLN